MKRWSVFLLLFFFSHMAMAQGSNYVPSEKIKAAQKEFEDSRYGLFIHWGPSSLLGAGEWVMNNRNIHVKDYSILKRVFNPVDFDAKAWVDLAKKSGMQYITFITRHHDGFSNWDTKASDWKVTNTPYGKDILKMLADECQRQNIKLFLYYSLLDWYREDYPHQTGRTGGGTGRKGKGNYDQYFQFMKTQLTELLTNYGPIAGIWLDGHWDQTAVEGAADRSSRIDWRYDELYAHIHNLQPQCLIGNNHHLAPFPGEDFQMFERDLPGQNTSGYNFQSASHLPLETCETINGSWGYNMTDRSYKSVKQIIHYLVNAAGRNANLLLNVGPMPNGEIQSEFRDTLTRVGLWLGQYGPSIYGTRGNVIPPQAWGVVTGKGPRLYVHWLQPVGQPYLFLPGVKQRIKNATLMQDGTPVKFKQVPEGVFVYTAGIKMDPLNTIIQLETQ